jgi:hypothetical protein
LYDQAGQLRREARAAIEAGDLARARALTARAEQLAAEVGAGVDAMEQRQSDDVMLLVAAHHTRSTAPRRTPRWLPGPRARKIGAAVGASLAMSLALVEC